MERSLFILAQLGEKGAVLGFIVKEFFNSFLFVLLPVTHTHTLCWQLGQILWKGIKRQIKVSLEKTMKRWLSSSYLMFLFCVCFSPLCFHTCASLAYVCCCFFSPHPLCFGRQFKPKKAEIVIDFNSINHPGMLKSATKWKCKRLTLGSRWTKRGGRRRLTRLKGTLMPLFCMSSCPLLCPKENSRIPRLWRLLIFFI